MLTLRDIQEAFSDGIIKGKLHPVSGMIVSDRSAVRSLALYRRLIRGTYRETLRVTYPVMYRFVGSRFFGVVARGYLAVHPSTSGDLFSYGRHLPAFLEEQQASRLLVELARLEWACHEVYQAAESSLPSEDSLRAVASADAALVRVRVQAAVRLLRFALPVHHVWLALQADAPPDLVIDLPLPDIETWVAVTRTAGRVRASPLTAAEYRLLVALSQGANLAAVERMVLGIEPEFDFPQFVKKALTLGLLGEVAVREAP